jgi:HPt (histidine-containing phosphotransfer) domain-containing protein
MASRIDRQKIEELFQFDVENDDTLLQDLIRMFGESFPERLQGMKNALTSGNWKELTRFAHTLKSTSGNLGLSEIQEHCSRLEALAPQGQMTDLAPLIEKIELEMATALNDLKNLAQDLAEKRK